MHLWKAIAAACLGLGAVRGANYLLDLIGVQLGSASALAVYGAVAFLIIYCPAPKRQFFTDKKKTEYLLNGQGEITDKVFRPSDFSEYSELEHDSEGRILTDAAGKIVCTRYAVPGQNDGAMCRTHLVLLCLISMCLSVVFEQLLILIYTGQIRAVLYIAQYLVQRFEPEKYALHIWDNIESMFRAVKTIRLDIDFGLCLEIIKENLERLSILHFT